MNYNLQIQSEAIIDIQEAFEWYEKQRDGLDLNSVLHSSRKLKF